MRSRRLGTLVVAALALLGATPGGESATFGAPPTLEQATPLAELLANPEAFAERTVLVRGEIHDVCQKKGCWTILRDGEAFVRVRFADYAFFVPKDSRGREAVAQGQLTLRTLSEREARHYEAETRGGAPESVEGPQREVGFLATGIRIAPAR